MSRRTLLRPLLLALLLSPAAAQAAAQAPGSSREADLAAIRAEIGRLERRLEEVREREEGLGGRLRQVEVELALQRRRVEEAEAARDVAVERAEAAEGEVERLGEALEEARRALRRRLAGLYRLGAGGYLRLVLSVEPGSDPLEAVRLLRFLVRRDAEAVDRYLDVREGLHEEQAGLDARRREAESWAEEESTRRDRLVSVRRLQERLLAETAAERRNLASRASELSAKEQRLEDLIASLAAGLDDPVSGRSILDFQGVLDWPAAGEVATPFGPRLDPRYGTRVPHNGIEIATEPGRPAAAVFSGKVMYAAPLQGYGPTVVVLHPGRVFTLYAGLERMRVAAEDVVSLGAMLGSSSDRLYFEIRVDNRPQDPLEWLR